jgi:hypothetical protein
MKLFIPIAVVASLATIASAGDTVTPGVIFGSGNANGNFTIATGGGVELGLRAKIPFVGTTNYDGVDTYTYDAGETWNFDWSVNSDVAGSTGNKLNDFTYALSMFKVDADGTNPADALTFDLINTVFADHSIGDNSTTAATDTIAADATEYATLIAGNNVAQNSWRYGFFPFGAIADYDVNDMGTYIVRLTAFDGAGATVASDTIYVTVVPLPTAAFAGLGLLGALGGIQTIRRRK